MNGDTSLVKLPFVPKNYLCKGCGMKGDHWIMKCVKLVQSNENKKGIRYIYKLLTCGYCREHEKKLDTKNIPQSLVECIYLNFYMKYKILGCGQNYWGSLSLGNAQSIENWTELTDLQNICSNYKHIYKNCNSITVISADGKLYSAGHQLGFCGQEKNVCRLKQFPIDIKKKVILASTGLTNKFHRMIFTENDELYGIGYNCNGMFGNGKAEPMVRHNLLQIPRFWSMYETIKQISCGYRHTLFLTTLGNVYACGYNNNNEVLKDQKGGQILSPVLIEINVIKVKANNYWNVMINNEYDLIIFGGKNEEWINNKSGQDICLYFKMRNIKIKFIDVGSSWLGHCALITQKNGCYAFGNGGHGQIGNGDNEWNVTIPYLVKFDGNEFPVQISCGSRHNIVLTNQNNIYWWGELIVHNRRGKDKVILSPQLLDKEKELKIHNNSYVDYVMALNDELIIFINQNKQVVNDVIF